MGSYGIGIERILRAAVELYHDEERHRLPPSIAPFEVVITPVNNGDGAAQMARPPSEIYDGCSRAPASTPCSTTATSAPA